MNVHPHLSTPDPYLLPFSLVWLVLRCLAVFSSARMEHSPGTRYDSPAHYLLNLCCWRVNLVHFPSSPFSPVGKREIEEEVNQARALTYSTKKENCAVVNNLPELLLITSFLFSQPLLRSVEQERKRSKLRVLSGTTFSRVPDNRPVTISSFFFLVEKEIEEEIHATRIIFRRMPLVSSW